MPSPMRGPSAPPWRGACRPPQAGQIVTFGITPTHAETGYGWLELATAPGEAPLPLTRFRRKARPDPVAESHVRRRQLPVERRDLPVYRARPWSRPLPTHAPEFLGRVRFRPRWTGRAADLGFLRLDARTAWGRDPRYLGRLRGDGEGQEPLCRGLWRMAGPIWAAGMRWAREMGARCARGVSTSGAVTAIDCHRFTLLRSDSEGLELVGIWG